MPEDIKTGDVVRLKSGGPKMTVTEVEYSEMAEQRLVYCVWFNEKNQQSSGSFPLPTVELAD